MGDRNKRCGGGHARHGSHDAARRASRHDGWYSASTKKGQLLIQVENGHMTAYSPVDGAEVPLDQAALQALVEKGTPCPNGGKLVYDAQCEAAAAVAV